MREPKEKELTRKQKAIINKSKDAKFYFINDDLNLPRGTVCIIKSGQYFARGIALCSMSTKLPVPEKGCFYAWRNAMRALNRKVNDLPILRDEAFEVIHKFKSKLWCDHWEAKAIFDASPDNGMEKRFFKILENGEKKGGTQGEGVAD